MSTYNAIKYNVSFANAGGLKLIKTLTASSSSTLSFVDGASDVVLDNTYKEYLFIFNNIHASEQAHLTVNFSVDSGSNYNVSKTTTFFFGSHDEADTATSLSYQSSHDITGTGAHSLGLSFSSDNDAGGAGYMHLFDPSNTTFVKHYIARTQANHSANYSMDSYIAGYFNTTSAIDAIRFKVNSGYIDSGVIKLYGVS